MTIQTNKVSFFYVLHCKDGTFYGGYTTDLTRRLDEHNRGVGAKYTRPQRRRPLRMIYAESYETRSAATKAEAAFKKLNRKHKEQFLKRYGVNKPYGKLTNCVIRKGSETGVENTEEL
ncbi:MAG: GIY-YIG nuclease family protein [Alkalibacterium sp.]|nr:GIY-YIG nuclease family protein [Alkalibacterium sp.]